MRGSDAAIAQTWIFLAGYLAIWLLFAVAAAVGQQMLSGGAMMLADERLATGVLIAAGAYQLSPLKSACLRQCRSPAQFLSRHWRPGAIGALRLGALHGAYCVGCCWLLMTLLFVGGIMNFAWIAALTLIVGVEKLLPGGEWLGRIAGVALIAWGAARLLA
jgi:predicted metal-binding membrane protein